MNAAPWIWIDPSQAQRAGLWPICPLISVSDPVSSPDVDLLRRIAEGDTAALGAFYDLHASTLFGLAYRILNDAKDAEDVLQEVFLQVWNKGASYDAAQGRPLAWVLTLTRHKAIDRLRATQRRRARFVDEPELVQEFPATHRLPRTARTNEQAELLRRALV